MLLAAVLVAGCRERRAVQAEAEQAGVAPVRVDAPAADAASAQPVHIVYPPAPASFIRTVDDLGGAVVNVRAAGQVTGGPASLYPNARPDSSLGSGFIVDREAGYVLTNHHIVDQATGLRVMFASGEERDARVIGRAPHLDIALLELSGVLSRDVPELRLGESDNLRVGEWVVALGNPFGGEVTASAGIISSLGGTSSLYEPPQERYRSLLHTDAAIHAGNSGGPLVNLAGEVVGVNTAMGRGSAVFGFAVPMSQVHRIFEALQQGRVAETWLGIFVLPVTEASAGACGARGAVVTQVLPNSPAAKAGLRQDDVIVKFDRHDVDEPKLAALARTAVPGQRIEMRVCREGNEIDRVLVAEAKPN
jgi:serine protease Do